MKPAFQITGLSGLVRMRLISLSVTDESTEQSDTCTLELSDPRNEFDIPDDGHVISVSLGYETTLRDMGQFVIDSVKIAGPAHRITLEAKAAPFTAAGGFTGVQTRNTRSFDEITLGALVATIAGEHGLAPAISPELASQQLLHIDQTNESDINFLTRLARQFQAVCKPTFGRLVFAKRGEGKSVSGLALPSVSLDPTQVTSWSGTLGKRTNFAKVQTAHHDAETGETVTHDAEGSDVSGGGEIYQHAMPFATAEEAIAAAASMLDQFQRGAQEMSFNLPGNPNIFAEATISVSGFHPRLDGPWLVKRVEHRIESGGYTSSVSCELPGGEPGATRTAAKTAAAEKKATSYTGSASAVTWNPSTNSFE